MSDNDMSFSVPDDDLDGGLPLAPEVTDENRAVGPREPESADEVIDVEDDIEEGNPNPPGADV